MLAWTTYIELSARNGRIVSYRISAGYCSIITKRAVSRCLNEDNRQLARVFLCLFIINRGNEGILREISCLKKVY